MACDSLDRPQCISLNPSSLASRVRSGRILDDLEPFLISIADAEPRNPR
jgi:hypothetical protein